MASAHSSAADPFAKLAKEPSKTALVFDVDGTLAPIVKEPEDAAVPDEMRERLRELAGRYALVACISGRAAADAERVVGVPELLYVGTHGLELSEEAEAWRDRIREFRLSVEWPAAWVEDKGLALALHFRQHEAPRAARHELDRVAKLAEQAGLRSRFGRMVLEILPPVDHDKGTAITALLKREGLSRALYAGDDTTDLDAFRALGEIELGVRVAVNSDEAPGQLLARADVVVEGTEGLAEALADLG